jgi:hypothetical protein
MTSLKRAEVIRIKVILKKNLKIRWTKIVNTPVTIVVDMIVTWMPAVDLLLFFVPVLGPSLIDK